jgi:hypothetical protein
VPRWLAGWGLAAEVLMLVACLGALFSGNLVTSYKLLVLPIAVEEMALALWLLARGFGRAAAVAEPRANLSTATRPAPSRL